MSLQRITHIAAALLGALTLTALSPGSAMATSSPTPNHDSTHPRVMQQAAAQVATANTGPLKPFAPLAPQPAIGAGPGGGGPQREIFGFALASSLADPTIGYPTWNFSLLSTVAIFGLHVQDDGTFAADSAWSVWNSSQVSGLLAAAHPHATKVVLTIILQDFGAGTPHMCSGLTHSATTIANTVAEVKAKGVDGVNVDYEGLNGACGTADPSWARHTFTAFAAGLRAAMTPGSYLSVDSYASSASDPLGFFDVPGLSASIDSFFVMAYDLEFSNYSRPPASCSSFCLGPTAPLAGYYYNDTSTASQYVSVVPSSKVILGVPYYGRKACVGAATPNQYPSGSVVADGYLDASGESTAPGVRAGSFAVHRDANDPSGQERWDTWFNTSMNCTRELYWDDATSLGLKYGLVNKDNLRGVGIWNLNYGGGAPELWSQLAANFTTATPWTSLGGLLTSGPDAASWASGRVDVFVHSSDNQLYHAWKVNGQWNPWQPLGGSLTSDPSAVSWGVNRVDVFARGPDMQLWHLWWDGARWNGWQPLGGRLTSGPDVSSWSAGRLDVFARGPDNQLYHEWWDGVRWNSWQPLGGLLTSDPTAVSWGPNRIDVFARGPDNGLWHLWWDGVRWNGWQPLGGILTSSPDASSCAPGHLDVFVTGPDSASYQLGFNGSWGAWQRLGGYWTSSPGAVCEAGAKTADLFERGTDSSLWQTNPPAS